MGRMAMFGWAFLLEGHKLHPLVQFNLHFGYINTTIVIFHEMIFTHKEGSSYFAATTIASVHHVYLLQNSKQVKGLYFRYIDKMIELTMPFIQGFERPLIFHEIFMHKEGGEFLLYYCHQCKCLSCLPSPKFQWS